MNEEINQQNTDQQFQDRSQPAENKPENVNSIAILSYLSILFLFPLLMAKDDEFAQYHAKQGLVLALAWILFFLLIAIITPMFMFLPYSLSWMFMYLYPLASVFFIVLSIIGTLNVLNGNRKELPIFGKYAKKINI